MITANHPFYLKTEQAIVNGAGQLTKADIIKLTGAEHDEATEVLLIAVRNYHCSYRITDEGVMIFDFGRLPNLKSAHQPGTVEKTWQLFLNKIKEILTLWIRYVLVWVYGFIFWTLARAILKTHKNPNQKNKKLSKLILDFTFGPTQPPADELARQKELAAFAADHDGVISVYDVILLFGCNKEEAEELLYECIIRYNGSARLDENHAVFYAEFTDLLTGKSKTATGSWTLYYEKSDVVPVFSGNPPGIDKLLMFLNVYTLIMVTISAVVGHDSYFGIIKAFGDNPILATIYTINILAVVFMSLGIILPVHRKYMNEKTLQEIQHNEFKKLVFMALQDKPAGITQKEIEQWISAKVSSAKAEQTARKLMIEFNAEPQVNQQGIMYYDLSEWTAHCKAMQDIRLSKRSEKPDTETTAFEDSAA